MSLYIIIRWGAPGGYIDTPIDRPANAYVHHDAHVDWVELDDGLCRLGGRTGTESIEPE